MHPIEIFLIISVQIFLFWRITNKMATISEQVAELLEINAELKETIAEEAIELGTKIDALEAKIIELGEVDPDLTELIADMRSSVEAVEALSGEEVELEEVEPEVIETPALEVPAEPLTPAESTEEVEG